MPHLEDRKYYFLSSTFVCVHSWLSRISGVSLCWWIYIHTHTQYIRSHNTADNWSLISVGAASNSGKLLYFKFWHETSCQLCPSLLFTAQADSFGCLPCLGQPGEAQLRKDTEPPLSPTGVWWGLGQVMQSKPSWSLSQREGADQEKLDLWCTLWWGMKTVFLSFSSPSTKWKDSPEKHECKNSQDKVKEYHNCRRSWDII